VPADRDVTDAEFFGALRAVVLWGDLHELAIEPDDPSGVLDLEQETRRNVSALLACIARGDELPQALGMSGELAVIQRWICQRRAAPTLR